MIRIVLDTNILISAIGWSGKSRRILVHCIAGRIKLITSLPLLDEILAVLNRPKFSFISASKKQEFFKYLLTIAEVVEPRQKVDIIQADPEDNRVLECALEGKADYIISEDKHLLSLKEYKGIRIATGAQFLRIFEER